MFDESRGSTGTAMYPTYLRRDDGGFFEEELGQDIIKAYDETGGKTFADYSAISDTFRPSQEMANKRGASVFDGGLQTEMMKNFEPVKTARVQFKRQSAIDSLNKTLGAIEAMQATKGYQGDSYGARRLKLDSNRGAADAISGANLENLMEERRIKDAIIQTQLENLDLPASSAKSAMEFEAAPTRQYLDLLKLRMSPLDSLRIGPGQFRYDNVNTGYRPSVTASLLGSLADGASMYAGYKMGQPRSSSPSAETVNRGGGAAFSNDFSAFRGSGASTNYGTYPGQGVYTTNNLASWNMNPLS
jgi:hypothetical protein